MKKMPMLALLSGLLILCTACDEGTTVPPETEETTEAEETTSAQETLSSEEISELLAAATTPPTDAAQNDETITTDPEEAVAQADFGTAVYLAKMDDGSERYFFFYGNGTGAYLEQEDGAGRSFAYEMTGAESAVFHIGSADASEQVGIYWVDADVVDLGWSNGRYERLTRLSDEPVGEFRFYTNQVLCERAMNVYEQKTGFHPSGALAWSDYDGMIVIQLYDDLGDHNSTADWYTVDRFTGIGTNLMGEIINLSDTPDVVPTEAETFPVETDPSETTETETTVPVQRG